MAVFSDLPRELVMNIFVRLPVKILGRLMCVAKPWHSLIADPAFIALHLKPGRGDANSYLIRIPEEFSHKKRFCTLMYDQSMSVKHFIKREIPFRTHSGKFYVVGTCNGLLCLSEAPCDRFNHFVYLWNPSLRRFKTIRCSCPDHRSVDNEVVKMLGFGFDHRTNDFLVLRIVYLYDSEEKSYYGKKMPYIELYSLNEDSWSRVESVLPYWPGSDFLCHPFDKSRAFLNGALHMSAVTILTKTDYYAEHNSIVSFEMAERAFKMIELPDECFGHFADRGLSPDDWTPGVFQESLALVVHGGADDHGLSKVCYIWIMKEYGVVESWSKQFLIELEGMKIMPLGFRKNGELLLDDDGELISRDLESGKSKELGFPGRSNRYDVVPFMESLCLLEETVIFGLEQPLYQL